MNDAKLPILQQQNLISTGWDPIEHHVVVIWRPETSNLFQKGMEEASG